MADQDNVDPTDPKVFIRSYIVEAVRRGRGTPTTHILVLKEAKKAKALYQARYKKPPRIFVNATTEEKRARRKANNKHAKEAMGVYDAVLKQYTAFLMAESERDVNESGQDIQRMKIELEATRAHTSELRAAVALLELKLGARQTLVPDAKASTSSDSLFPASSVAKHPGNPAESISDLA